MSPENTKYLLDKHPGILGKLTWGFECGDGWFNIINQLCQNIQHHIDWKNKSEEVVPQVVVDQVKEKFGSLRFYYHGGDDYISGLVSMAESMSGVTCEVCGSSGESRNEGWIKVLCEEHHLEQETRRQERMKS